MSRNCTDVARRIGDVAQSTIRAGSVSGNLSVFLADEGGNDMAAIDESDDVRAIRALIGAHFQGLRWSANTSPDWNTFRSDFLPDASLFGAAPPGSPTDA